MSAVMVEQRQTCNRCEIEKPETAFDWKAGGPPRRARCRDKTCKECRKADARRAYLQRDALPGFNPLAQRFLMLRPPEI